MEVGKWQVGVGLGLGLRTNPLVDSKGIPIVILPQVSYYGKKAFLDNLVLGWTFLDNRSHSLSAITTIGFDQVYFNRSNIGNFALEGGGPSVSYVGVEDTGTSTSSATLGREPGEGAEGPSDGQQGALDGSAERINVDELSHRSTALYAGVEYGAYMGHLMVQLQVLQDISSVHNGQELRIAGVFDIPAKRSRVDLSLGVTWQSAENIDYYYGVNDGELESSEVTYEADSGGSPFVKINWSRPVSKKWSLGASLHYKYLATSIRNSPIVEDASVATLFFGANYKF